MAEGDVAVALSASHPGRSGRLAVLDTVAGLFFRTTALAARAPDAATGFVEVRPVQDLSWLED